MQKAGWVVWWAVWGWVGAFAVAFVAGEAWFSDLEPCKIFHRVRCREGLHWIKL